MINKLYNKSKKIIKENILGIIILIITILILTIDLPWSIYAPGGTINLNERINGVLYESKGSLNMTYVSFIKGKVPTLILSLLLNDWDIVPNSKLTYENETLEDMNIRDKIYMQEAISNATYVGYSASLITPNIINTNTYVVYISEYANTELKIGDIILGYDEYETFDLKEINHYISTKQVGDVINLKVKRNERVINVKATIIELNHSPKIGISFVSVNEYQNEPNIEIKTKNNESSSSGGLMMSLAIYNGLTEKDITKNKNICGTGTIDIDGTVGEISGVKYKIIGAYKNKCDVFLVPTANYEEALKEVTNHKFKLQLIEAKTFNQVLEELNNI